MKQLDSRLAALEKRHTPPGRVLVCFCATNEGRRNMPAGEHLDDCPALSVGPCDTLVRVVYGDVPEPSDNPTGKTNGR